MVESIYDSLSKERKKLQEAGELPEWFTTLGWQAFKSSIAYKGETFKGACNRISSTLARHMLDPKEWQPKFYSLLWDGNLAGSTPALANIGTDRGCAVSCSGNYVFDGVYDFYETLQEAAILSQQGFGTSSYLGDVRPRGSAISRGGKASGVILPLRNFVNAARDISQGGVRRGSWAGYYPIDGNDFWEIVEEIKNKPDDLNIGWNISDAFIQRLESGDKEALSRYQRALKIKCITGKGYFLFIDRVNKFNPPMYKELGLSVKASNLCTEITLHSDIDHTFSCVLSSLNLANWDKFDKDTIFNSIVFLDCIAEEFIQVGKNIRGLEKVIRFTEKSRALGLGALGFHTYLQQNNVPFESLEAQFINDKIFKKIKEEAVRATKWLAEHYGEPEWCKGYGVRNTHLLAIAPNTTSALICGSVSQGIEPIYKNAYTQGTASGEMSRINPVLIDVLKAKGKYTDAVINDIINHKGSVQHLDFLSDHEKLVFKTAFEIDQKVIVRLAALRQKYICQSQSLNLFFAADEDERYISEVHKEAFLNENIKSLYYLRSEAGVQASKECIACHG